MAQFSDPAWGADDDDLDDDFLAPPPGPTVLPTDVEVEIDDPAALAIPGVNAASSGNDLLDDPDEEFDDPTLSVAAHEDDLPEDGDHWEPALGFPSVTNALRIWADENGEITKIRLSLGWRERVKDSSLSEAFSEALTLLNNYYLTTEATLVPSFALDIPQTDQQLSWQSLAAAQQRIDALRAELAELPAEPLGMWQGNQPIGQSADGKVRVEMDIFGHLQHVVFDEDWLQIKATASEIARDVMAAYQDAKAQHVEPVMVLTARGEIARQIDQATLELFGQARNGLASQLP